LEQLDEMYSKVVPSPAAKSNETTPIRPRKLLADPFFTPAVRYNDNNQSKAGSTLTKVLPDEE
jgi:hypothetical protein